MADNGDAGLLRRGLPMVQARDSEALEREKARLREIDARPGFLRRWRGYWSLSGPGWVQSALTLGAGSAGSAIYAGAVFGYQLLWVQPVAMFLGVVVFAAIGHQALVTQARPYDAFRKELHPALAVSWGAVVLVASVIWQFPQYALAVNVGRDILDVAGLAAPRAPIALRCSPGPRRSAGATGKGAAAPSVSSSASSSTSSSSCRSSSLSWSSRPASISGPCSRGCSGSTSRATARA